MSGHEQRHVTEAFASNWVSTVGPNIDALEREFEERLGSPVAAVASGTAAIHLGLRVLGVERCDDVFCSTLTFVATANPILYLGARPVFIDSNTSTWNMDPSLLAEALHRRARYKRLPRAVVVVHLYGQCADMAPILEACTTYGVPVLEDAAESLGAFYRGRPAATLGDVGAISLNGNKIITAAGGGLLVTRERDGIRRVKYWAAQSREPGIGYEHRELGYNYCLSNVLAGIARGQLTVLDERVRRRREIASNYQAAFCDLPGIALMPQCEYGLHTNWLSCVLIDEHAFGATRDDMIQALRTADIEARPVWKPLHQQPIFKDTEVIGGSVAEALHRCGLCLPSSSSLTREDQDRVVEVVRSVFQRRRTHTRKNVRLESPRVAKDADPCRWKHADLDTRARSRNEAAAALLARPEMLIDTSGLASTYNGQTVLITGAGGTIGGELARQITELRVRRVVLFDRSENDLCRVELELRNHATGPDVIPIVGDILDRQTLADAFRAFRPGIVLHAAAYKHVTLMEQHPVAAIRNNVFGTCNIATLARRYGARSCVLVSTDKAVTPTSVMGVSKRIAELVFLSRVGRCAVKFRVVRLGNVFSSNGSVVPLFQRQIAESRPLTVTDAQATRYFVTVAEAARLVLAAVSFHSNGELFLPDMRDPVRILDLAYGLADIEGFPPGQRPPILLTGLRPGEKQHEDLLFPQETVEQTEQPFMLRVRGPIPHLRGLRHALRALRSACDRRDLKAVGNGMREIVPEFQPSAAFQTLMNSRPADTRRNLFVMHV